MDPFWGALVRGVEGFLEPAAEGRRSVPSVVVGERGEVVLDTRREVVVALLPAEALALAANLALAADEASCGSARFLS